MSDRTNGDPRLDRARSLVKYLEAGESDAADQLIGELAGSRDGGLFIEVGRLTRELHDAINGFVLDGRVEVLASEEIPDATERLKYLIAMTEKLPTPRCPRSRRVCRIRY